MFFQFIFLKIIYAQITPSNSYKISNIPYAIHVHNIKFCLTSNKYNIAQEVVDVAFASINSQLIRNGDIDNAKQYGLYLSPPIIDCDRVNVDEYTQLIFGPPVNSSAMGVTRRQFMDGSFSTPFITMDIPKSVYVDVRVLQSAASFYNVLLHELLHCVGLDHHKILQLENVMSYRVRRSVDYQVLQDHDYITLQPGDIRGMHAILRRDKPNFIIGNPRTIGAYVPSIDGNAHVSGTDLYFLPPSITIPSDTNNQVKNHWVRKYGNRNRNNRNRNNNRNNNQHNRNRNNHRNTNNQTPQPIRQSSQPTYQPTRQSSQPTYQPTRQSSQPTYQPTRQSSQPMYQPTQQLPATGNTENIFNVKTRATPLINAETDTTIVSIKTKANPVIDIEAGTDDNSFTIYSDISPQISIDGNSKNIFNIVTDVSPVITLRASGRQVSTAASEFDIFIEEDAFFN